MKKTPKIKTATITRIQCQSVAPHMYFVRVHLDITVSGTNSLYYCPSDLMFDLSDDINPPRSEEEAVCRAIEFMTHDNKRRHIEFVRPNNIVIEEGI